MLSIENPLDYASQAEAEGNAENTKVMTALRVFQNFVKNISNYTVSALNTTSKNIIGAINELFTSTTANTTAISELKSGSLYYYVSGWDPNSLSPTPIKNNGSLTWLQNL